MASITTNPHTLEKLDAIAKVLQSNALWGKRGFRSEAHRIAVDILYQLVFHPTIAIDLEKHGLMRTDSTNRPLNP